MTVSISKPAINLRKELNKGAAKYRIETFAFTGDSSETTFALPNGWEPKFVYSDGARKREGSGNDYTVTFDGFIYSVVFAVAPAVVFVDIDCEVSE
jgi:hypothetical protein